MIFEHMILLLLSYIMRLPQLMLANHSFLKKKKKKDLFSTGEVSSWSTCALIYKPAHQWPSWNLHLYFDKCCSESDSLGDLETTKGQIESVSQTFVSSIINAPLLFSLSDPFNLFSISHIFSSPLTSHKSLPALLSRFSSLVFSLMSLVDMLIFQILHVIILSLLLHTYQDSLSLIKC